YQKWFGNYWLAVNWANDGEELKNFPKAALRNQSYYFQEGLTYSSSGSKGASFRVLPKNFLFSGGGPGITLKQHDVRLNYLLGFLNSPMSSYLLSCLNPTVNTTQGDLNRIPFVVPEKGSEDIIIEKQVAKNIEIQKRIQSFHSYEFFY